MEACVLMAFHQTLTPHHGQTVLLKRNPSITLDLQFVVMTIV